MMISSASALLLTTVVSPAATDITPLSLAVRLNAIEIGSAPYDWALQQAGGMTGVKLADTTATCDTGPICSPDGKYCTHDCRFVND